METEADRVRAHAIGVRLDDAIEPPRSDDKRQHWFTRPGPQRKSPQQWAVELSTENAELARERERWQICAQYWRGLWEQVRKERDDRAADMRMWRCTALLSLLACAILGYTTWELWRAL